MTDKQTAKLKSSDFAHRRARQAILSTLLTLIAATFACIAHSILLAWMGGASMAFAISEWRRYIARAAADAKAELAWYQLNNFPEDAP